MGKPDFAGRAVYVVGAGLHRYKFPSETPYVVLGLTAVRAALTDAGIEWRDIEGAVVGSAAIGMAAGRMMLRHLGSTGLSVQQVENASASGSTAFRAACMEVLSGAADVMLAVGVDKFGGGRRAASKDGLERLSDTAEIPAVKFALLAQKYRRQHGISAADMARVAVKNHRNAARNPFAQFQKPRTLEEVLASPKIVGDLTVQQCCPRGEGAAAAIVASEAGINRLGIDRSRAVRVLASVSTSEQLAAGPDRVPIVDMVRDSGRLAYEAAGIGPSDLDVLELHDAFSIEEILYTEALGICREGEGAIDLRDGRTDIGGACAVNASGGLLGMGHPLGPTGIGQIVEIVRQLRGEAGARQHPNAHLAMAHMIGLGSIAIAHVLQRS